MVVWILRRKKKKQKQLDMFEEVELHYAEDLASKVEHVKDAKQDRDHTCHWPGCDLQVAPALWGCKRHWYMLPIHIRKRIWATYKIGQERGDARVSSAYVAVAREAEEFARNYGHAVTRPV